MNPSPTVPPKSPLSSVVSRNIDALQEVEAESRKHRTLEDRAVDAVTAFAGSTWFVYLHAGILLFWLLANTGKIPGLRPWDPYPFVMLAMAASVEAIFVSTFVLIGQNRAAVLAEKRAELDLQVNLLAEHEMTRLVQMVDAICRKMDIGPGVPDLSELKRDIAPENIVAEIEKRKD
ncbi:DUF1003 domain-containing protein [bacterium]|nr:MAG: DUF1003 domain-containing protein [bacterium]